MYIHGINGHPKESWTSKSGFFWPSHPLHSESPFRVLTFGYVADLYEDSNSMMAIRDYSSMLSATLLNHRQNKLTRRPLVFICHDIGGLIVKRMLVKCSNKTAGSPFAQLLKSTKCVVFFGTPHRGHRSLERILTSVIEKLKLPFNAESKKLSAAVKPGAEELFAINEDFASIGMTIPILNFYEIAGSHTKSGPFVDRESAIMHYENEEFMGLRRNHRDLTRFESASDDVYGVVRDTIGRIIHSTITKETNFEEMLAFRKALLNRLRHPLRENRIDKIAEAQENTFEWIWSEDEPIKHWLCRERGLFWISGKPGSGKSTMMKKVFLDIERQYARSEIAVVGFFFSNLGEKLGRTFEGLLSVILEKLLRQRPEIINIVIDNFPEVFEDWNSLKAGPSSEELAFEFGAERLKRTVLDVVRRGPRSMKLVVCVDALDECDDMTTKHLISCFRQLVSETNQTSVRVCFSGRGIADAFLNTEEELKGFTMEDRSKKDIEAFVSNTISAFPFSKSETFVAGRLIKAVVSKANGVFLWAVLVCRKLSDGCEQGDTLTEMLGSLKTIPPELSGVFSSMLASVDETHIAETNFMLALMLAAERPLEVEELCFAMALGSEVIFSSQKAMQENSGIVHSTPIMMRRIRHRCRGLLEGIGVSNPSWKPTNASTHDSSKETIVIQFVHQTVKGFLLSRADDENGVLKAEDLLNLGHKTFSRACLRYLVLPEVRHFTFLFPNSQSGPAKVKWIEESLPFARYAAANAIEHYQFTEDHHIAETQELERLEANGEEGYRTWRNLSRSLDSIFTDFDDLPDPQVNGACLLQDAVVRGFVAYARKKFESGVKVNETIDGDCHQWLFYGISSDSVPMVEMLLEQGANPNTGDLYNTPLLVAILLGNVDMVRLLLQNNADPLESKIFTSVLEIAGGQHQWEILELLLEQNCEVFSNSWICQITFLQVALNKTKKGEEYDPKAVDVLTALIQRSSDFSLDPEAFQESLLRLLGTYPDEITRAILDQNSNILTKRSRLGVSAIHVVCASCSISTVRTLLDYGADINTETDDGCTTLFCAIRNPDIAVLSYLLENKIDPNVESNFGHIALHHAAACGSKKHIVALLEAGSVLPAVDRRSTTVCHFAMINPRIADTFEELKCTTMLCMVDRSGNTPLHWAAEYGRSTAVNMALENGSDLAARNRDGMSALHFAARNIGTDADSIVQIFVDKGCFVSVRDDLDQTPLHHVFHVLECDDDIPRGDMYNIYPPTPFDILVAEIIVMALTRNEADLNAQDVCGNTPLHLACWRDAFDIVFLLLQAGSDITLTNTEGKCAVDMTGDEDIRRMIEVYVHGSVKPERNYEAQRAPTRRKQGNPLYRYGWLTLDHDLA